MQSQGNRFNKWKTGNTTETLSKQGNKGQKYNLIIYDTAVTCLNVICVRWLCVNDMNCFFYILIDWALDRLNRLDRLYERKALFQ